MKIHIYPTVKTATRKLAALAALTLICVTNPGHAAQATGGGTVYYTHNCCRTMWTMNSDGSSKTQLGFATFGPVSTQLYNGHRWFMDARPIDPPEYYPNGDLRIEVFAFRDDYDQNTNNNSATRVQLTNDITFQTSYASGDPTYSLQWVPNGQKVSIKARRWSGTVVSEGGIYTASLQFGPDGNITGLAAQPGAAAIQFTLDSTLWPNVRSYGWDPTGIKIAYEDSATLGIADTLGSPHQIIYNGWSHTPQWSHDGNTIVFTNGSLGISTIKANGTHLTQIIMPASGWTYDRPYWSPADTNIVCYGVDSNQNLDVFRAASNGNFLTNLTNTPLDRYTGEMPQGWR